MTLIRALKCEAVLTPLLRSADSGLECVPVQACVLFKMGDGSVLNLDTYLLEVHVFGPIRSFAFGLIMQTLVLCQVVKCCTP